MFKLEHGFPPILMSPTNICSPIIKACFHSPNNHISNRSSTTGYKYKFVQLLGRKKFHELKINEGVIEPKLQYAGEWEYKTSFRLQSQDDGSEEYKRCKENMDNYPEQGLCKWTQNIFELKIEYANTESSKTIEKTPHPHISWQSSPISYDENEVRWSFNGKIWWKDEKNYANEFSGIEFYRVRECDALGRPCYLEGRLIGTILVGKHFFVVDAISSFTKKS